MECHNILSATKKSPVGMPQHFVFKIIEQSQHILLFFLNNSWVKSINLKHMPSIGQSENHIFSGQIFLASQFFFWPAKFFLASQIFFGRLIFFWLAKNWFWLAKIKFGRADGMSKKDIFDSLKNIKTESKFTFYF